MREILFRGKDFNGKWVYGCYCHQFPRHGAFGQQMTAYDVERHLIVTKKGIRLEVIPETIEQFTGLTDRNGKKVFEGDIVEFNAYGFHYVGVVIIKDGNTGIRCSNSPVESFADDAINKRNGVVTGNIHDSPELMEGGENNG